MTNQEKVVQCSTRYELAVHTAEKMAALYQLRRLLVEEPLETVLSIDAKLADLEKQIADPDKKPLRTAGYLFPEDFDTPTERMCND